VIDILLYLCNYLFTALSQLSMSDRMQNVPMKRSNGLLHELFHDDEVSDLASGKMSISADETGCVEHSDLHSHVMEHMWNIDGKIIHCGIYGLLRSV